MVYRKEIDGLRAVALVPVILYHAGFEWFSGGYVGVDVFFVISGYLITSLILTEKEAGTFSLVKFYERRARRILPALSCVMLVSLPFAWFWMMPVQLKDFAQSIVAVTLFASNILFWRESGYFDAMADEKPLLHTWSLAVEEQYYVIFPILFILFWWLGKRWLVSLICIVALTSFYLSEWGWQNDADAAFYLAPSRAWEILSGALAAFYLHANAQPNNKFNHLVAICGLLMVLYSVFMFDRHTPFPGIYALIPTVGTTLIILFAKPHTFLGKLLTLKPIVGIGLISYSAYLWHQPLFAFARLRSLSEPSAWLYGGLSIAALALAYFSWRYIENPARNRQKVSRQKIFYGAAVACVAMISVGWIGHVSEGAPSRLEDYDLRASEYGGEGAGISPEGAFYGLLGTEPSFIIYGDSHALQYIPALERLAKVNGFSFIAITHAACFSFPGVTNWYTEKRRTSCIDMVDVLKKYLDLYPIPVVLAHRWNKRLASFSYEKLNVGFQGEGIQIVFNALKALRSKYPHHHNNWLIIGNVPTSNLIEQGGYLRCKFKGYPECPQTFPIEKGELFSTIDEFEAFADATEGYEFIDPYEALCDDEVCFVKIHDKLVYSDHAHLSRFGAESVIEHFLSKLPIPKPGQR